MTTLDRYIVRLFFTNFLVLFSILIAMIVLSDLLLFNLDEFVQAAQLTQDNWIGRTLTAAWLVIDFWGPMIFLMFNYLVGLIPIGAAGFTLWTMIRNRELVALLASGVSMYRIAMPMLMVGFALNMLMVVNQELILPRLAHKLTRSQSDLKSGGYRSFDLLLTSDGRGRLFAGDDFLPTEGTMSNVTILSRPIRTDGYYGPATERITADSAKWRTAGNNTAEPSGWELTNGQRVWLEVNIDDPASQPTIQHREAIEFIPSSLDPLQLLLRHRSRFAQFLNIRDLLAILNNPAGPVDPAVIRRTLHARFSAVVINMLVLAMTLPCFLQRAPGSLMWPAVKAAGLGVGAWGSGLLALQMPPNVWLSPIAIAWMPVAAYIGVAVYLLYSVDT